MSIRFGNFATAKLATPPSGVDGLSFTVAAGKGTLFPTIAAGDWCYMVLKNSALVREVVKVEGRTGDAFTIAAGGRGVDGSSAYASWAANDTVEVCVVSASIWDLLYAFKNNFWNAAETFKSIFTNTNTAARTYTFQDRSGTIPDLEGANTFSGANVHAGAETFKGTSDATKIISISPDTQVATGTTNKVDALDSGTRTSFNQTAAPTGWTKDTTAALNDTAMRIVTGAVGSGGSVAFSSAAHTHTVSGSTGGFTLTTNEMPAHTHNSFFDTNHVAGGSGGARSVYESGPQNNLATSSVGGGAAHSHGAGTLAGASTALNLKYNDFIIASKN